MPHAHSHHTTHAVGSPHPMPTPHFAPTPSDPTCMHPSHPTLCSHTHPTCTPRPMVETSAMHVSCESCATRGWEQAVSCLVDLQSWATGAQVTTFSSWPSALVSKYVLGDAMWPMWPMWLIGDCNNQQPPNYPSIKSNHQIK